jgi:hypothetical protein
VIEGRTRIPSKDPSRNSDFREPKFPHVRISGLAPEIRLSCSFEPETPVRILRAGDFFLLRRRVAMADVVYENEKLIREVVEKFERCEYVPQEFTHARHLTVACWYLCTLEEELALIRMRESLLRFTAHHGKHGYHETITCFWMQLIAEHLRRQTAGLTDLQRINDVVACYPKETLFDFYTRERVMSEIAKREWIAPDLRGIRDAPQSRLQV